MRPRSRAARLAPTLLAAAALAGCGGNDLVGPPDGPTCTRGLVAPGDSVKGAITAASCVMFSDRNNGWVRAESWTLDAKRNTAYVVRLRHVENSAAVDNWNGDLFAYARNPEGDPVFGTGRWHTFGVANGNGGYDQELFLATDADRTISLRVQVSALADTGSYTLSVEGCPLHPISDGTGLTGIDVTTGCTSVSYAAAPIRLSFFSFPADTFHAYHALGSRTAGNGTISGKVTGPDLDVGCWTGPCTWSADTAGGTAFDLDLTGVIYTPGRQTLLVGVSADSTATVSVGLTATPLPVPPARALPGPRTH